MDRDKQELMWRSKIQINCSVKAALAIDKLHGRGKLIDAAVIIQELLDEGKKVINGDTQEIEQMLFTHAKTLDYVFYDALGQMADCRLTEHIQLFANIAFRAQNQSRKALLALAELKNPRKTTFIKQQNNAVNQQINNDMQIEAKNFENSDKVANELLEVKENGQWMDSTTQGAAITIDSSMETLEEIKRCKNAAR